MSGADQSLQVEALLVAAEVDRFYASYGEALDEARMLDWSEFFVEDCLYQIITRENFDAGYGLCIMQADGKGMIVDRVQGITRTQIFGPRTCRRFSSGTRILSATADTVKVRQNVLLVQTLLNEPSKILLCGVAHDELVRLDDRVLIKERIVVTDSALVESALIYPI